MCFGTPLPPNIPLTNINPPLTTPGTKCKRLGTTLTWDKPSRQVSDRRSREAGCGSSNRCSKSPYGRGYQCDEYPFRSVRESDRGGQPKAKSSATSTTRADSSKEKDVMGPHRRGPARRDVEAEGGSEFYRLKSGMVVFAPGGLEIGEVVYRTGVGNWTVFEDEGGEGEGGDGDALEDDDTIQVEKDRVVGVVGGWKG
ncbi:hypothetical protein AtubIFM56815_010721 [Aspergillus tubingensis]|uniref:Deoxyribonuclease NucA/NucB domain-containing protein n=1 Tax=Aspergillus tubingensis TaxID=5068 RepID=A0A9W6ASK6_ASPTU|nr:hypothetical protein AtubIFM56815_010721 [Aspergillus tubingensis]